MPHGRTLSGGAPSHADPVRRLFGRWYAGRERVDLHGAPACTVTDEAAAWALKELERLKDDRGPPNLRLGAKN